MRAAFFVLPLLVTGCNLRHLTVNQTADVLKAGSIALDAEADPRLARDALPGTIKTLDTFLAAYPEQPDLLELVAQARQQYAFAFLEEDLEQLPEGDSPQRQELVDRATLLYDSAYLVGLRRAALDQEQILEWARGDAATFTQNLKKVGKDGGPGLFWAGLSLASAVNLHRDDIERLSELPKAIALLERAHEVAPEYFNHGPALGLGVLYASQGAAIGGNPKRSKAMFDEVIAATGGRFLMARVLMARFYATVEQDRALYEKTLKEVIDTPVTVWPEQRLANEVARRRAARYLRMADDLF